MPISKSYLPSKPDLSNPRVARAHNKTTRLARSRNLLEASRERVSRSQRRDEGLVRVMESNGIHHPWEVLRANRRIGGTLSVSCASLQMESWGGLNIWGADPGGDALPFNLYNKPVTKFEYASIYRPRVRAGLTPNGCGPSQLTSVGLQEAADRRGGCWIPLYNEAVGFLFMKQLIAEFHSVQLGFQHYNGSGPAAERYGLEADGLQRTWHVRFLQVK